VISDLSPIRRIASINASGKRPVVGGVESRSHRRIISYSAFQTRLAASSTARKRRGDALAHRRSGSHRWEAWRTSNERSGVSIGNASSIARDAALGSRAIASKHNTWLGGHGHILPAGSFDQSPFPRGRRGGLVRRACSGGDDAYPSTTISVPTFDASEQGFRRKRLRVGAPRRSPARDVFRHGPAPLDGPPKLMITTSRGSRIGTHHPLGRTVRGPTGPHRDELSRVGSCARSDHLARQVSDGHRRRVASHRGGIGRWVSPAGRGPSR